MTTRLVPAAAGLAALLVLGACGSGSEPTAGAGGSSSSAAGSSPTSASSSTSAASDAGSGGKSIDGSTFGKDLSAAMVNAKTGRSTATIDAGTASTATPGLSGTTQVTMEFAFTAAKAMNMHATLKNGANATEIIVVDGYTYIKLPKAMAGKSWSKTKADSLGDAADPLAVTKAFAGATVTEVGDKHYTVKPATGGALDVYLDGDGRPTKVSGQVSGAKYEGTYSDWGSAITITAPPADQVATLGG